LSRLEKLGPEGGNDRTNYTKQNRINVWSNIGKECQKGQNEVEDRVGNRQE